MFGTRSYREPKCGLKQTSMMPYSYTEENYLKAIYHLSGADGGTSTNALAEHLNIKPATVTSMLKRLRSKGIVDYRRYGGVSLSTEGRGLALQIIRKHRLWEVFLVQHLNFTWDEVHEVAEQLEHIHSTKLIRELDAFLGHPAFDPHGDPIPDLEGRIQPTDHRPLAEMPEGWDCAVAAVNDASAEFLQDLMKLKVTLGTRLCIVSRFEFDNSLLLRIEGNRELTVPMKFACNLLVRYL